MKKWIDYIGIGCWAIVINDKNEVLLVKRSMSARTEPWTWSRPGGQVEFWETIEATVEREIQEEVGIEVKAIKLLEITQNIDPTHGSHRIAVGYLAQYISWEVTNMEPENHDAVQWFSFDNLPENINNYTRNAIAVYLAMEKKI